LSKLLVTLLAALTIVVMPLSGGAAAKTTDIYQLARQSVTVTSDGFFAIRGGLSAADSARLHRVFDSLNSELSRVDRGLRPSVLPKHDAGRPSPSTSGTGGHQASLAASWCGYIPRWAFEAYAWGVIIAGGVTATIGLFADGTIFGLPAGAVLGAAGLWLGMDGSAMLWFVDTYMPPWGVYVCVF
jgi:hypothetical protein